MLLWPRSNNSVETSYEVWPLIKVEVLVELQTLFLDQDMIQLLIVSYSGPEFGCSVVLASQIFLSLMDNSELTCCDIFIFQIHMVTQLDSSIWVEVHLVKETTKQVSSLLEHVWTFKSYCKNSKKFLEFSP